MYLSRLEGKRIVSRRTTVFDLDTSYLIIASYRKTIMRNYWDILERLSQLKEQNQKEKVELLKEIAEEKGHSTMYLGDDVMALSFLADVDIDKMRERLFLDCRRGVYKLVFEDKNERSDKVFYRYAPDITTFLRSSNLAS